MHREHSTLARCPLRRALTAGAVEHDRDALVAGHEAVPELGDFAVTGEHVYVLALHFEAAIFGQEAAIVHGGARGVAGHAVVFWNVDGRAERNDVRVDGDAE